VEKPWEGIIPNFLGVKNNGGKNSRREKTSDS